LLLSVLSHAGAAYRVIQTIPLPGDGGWDYLTLDPAARRLYISHATQVQVFDIGQEKLIGQIPDTPGVHGVALAPDLGRGFTSNGKEGTVTIFDLKTLKTIDRVKVDAENPDAILYDPATQHVFTFNGHSSNATAIDAATGKVLGHIALDGKPEFAVADGSGTIYVNLEDKSVLLRIDSKGLAVKARWPLAPCEEPSALAMDRASGRLFVGCGNKLMAVVDAASGKVLITLPIGDHVDAAVFDPGTRQAFSANGDGTLTVIQEDSPDKFHVVQNVQTQRGARTVALDPKTHRLYLADAQFGATPAPTADHPRPRPAILPGTFILLEVTP
jgi:DNA-binding beta-propeller fold protein YncE